MAYDLFVHSFLKCALPVLGWLGLGLGKGNCTCPAAFWLAEPRGRCLGATEVAALTAAEAWLLKMTFGELFNLVFVTFVPESTADVLTGWLLLIDSTGGFAFSSEEDGLSVNHIKKLINTIFIQYLK